MASTSSGAQHLSSRQASGRRSYMAQDQDSACRKRQDQSLPRPCILINSCLTGSGRSDNG